MLVVSEKTLPYAKQIAAMTGNGGPDGSAARKALAIIEKLQADISCTNFETNHGESRIKGCIKYDVGGGYRLVTIRPDGHTVVLCYLGSHDAAQRWLSEHEGLKLIKQAGSGRIEFIHTVREIPSYLAPTNHPSPRARPLAEGFPTEITEALFPQRSLRRAFESLTTSTDDDAILAFVVDVEADISNARAVVVLEVCQALRDGDLRKALLAADLALGRAQVVSPENPVTGIELRDPVNADSIIVLNDLPAEEWTRLWHPTRFQDWMLWLHPDQKRISEEKIPGPVVLDGVSGSGKTCVLVHRARRLAQRYPGERILVLTLNRSLARLIERLAQRLCSIAEISQLRVMAFHDYAGSLLKYFGLDRFVGAIREPLKLNGEIQDFVNSHALDELPSLFTYRDEVESQLTWNRFFRADDSGAVGFIDRLSEHLRKSVGDIDCARYLREELSIAQSVGTIDTEFTDYRRHAREGRSIRFGDGERETTLRLLQVWQKYQLRLGTLDDSWLTQAADLAVKSFGGIPTELRFRCVLIDEYQDFSSLELDLLRRIPTGTADGLFLTGDQAQRVHTKHLDFERASLSTILRRRIRKNYRNSREILEAGHKLLDGYCSVESARQAGVNVLPPEFAARHSAQPFVCKSNDVLRAAWSFAEEWIGAGNPPFSVCIVSVASTAITVDAIMATCPNNLKAARLSGDYMHESDAVVVADAATVKGFEFSLIVAVGLDHGEFPQKGAVEAELWRDALRLYVTITRARDELRFIYRDQPSPFLLMMSAATQAREMMFEQPAKPIPAVAPSIEPESLSKPAREEPPTARTKLTRPPIQGNVSSADPKPVVQPESVVPPAPHSEQIPDTDAVRDIDDDVVDFDPAIGELNGITILRTPDPCSQRSLVRLLGVGHTRIQHVCYELGLYLRPSEAIPKNYVIRIMAKFDCAPKFQ